MKDENELERGQLCNDLIRLCVYMEYCVSHGSKRRLAKLVEDVVGGQVMVSSDNVEV